MLTVDQLNAFLHDAGTAGWTVNLRPEPREIGLPAIEKRFGHLPTDYALFVSHVCACVNQAQNAWFLTDQDYNAVDVVENTFRWNEWELMSLAACDGDPLLTSHVTKFWNAHLPIMSSVHSDYAYIALRAADGVVVYGYSSDFEDPEIVCSSLSDYLSKLGDILGGRASFESVSATGEITIERAYSDFT